MSLNAARAVLIASGLFLASAPTALMAATLTSSVGHADILFASEMVGAVRGIDPETNHHYDDTRRYVDQVATLSPENRAKIFEGNARKVYDRLNTYLDRRSRL